MYMVVQLMASAKASRERLKSSKMRCAHADWESAQPDSVWVMGQEGSNRFIQLQKSNAIDVWYSRKPRFHLCLGKFFQSTELHSKRDKSRIRNGGTSVHPKFRYVVVLCTRICYVDDKGEVETIHTASST